MDSQKYNEIRCERCNRRLKKAYQCEDGFYYGPTCYKIVMKLIEHAKPIIAKIKAKHD